MRWTRRATGEQENVSLVRDFVEQAGAIPYRQVGNDLEVLLITSRSSGEWIVPKGMVDPGHTPRQAALQEALEEAGVIGQLGPYLGHMDGLKGRIPVRISLFGLAVEEVLEAWMEQHFRKRRWFRAQEAMARVRDPQVGRLIHTLLKQNRLQP